MFRVSDLWELYRTGHISQKVAAKDRLHFAWNNLKPHFGSLSLWKWPDEAVDQYRAKRLAGKIGRKAQQPTIRRELNALRACLNWCAHPARKLIAPATIPYIELPEHGEPADRWLTTYEIKKLFEAAARMRRVDKDRLSRCERFLWLALETGARKGAICDLTWDRVDFETNVIHYDVPGLRKTKKRRPSPPISTALRAALERMRDERRPKDGDLVVFNNSDPRTMVMRAAKLAGVRGVTPHVLRHTAATHMARRGVPLWKIAKILGITLAMVERTYAKHSPDDLREAVDTITGGAVQSSR
ncbi:tyrosine-type recombinase/integrase [Reyranella sp.]|uniref:tyrosine-type recombinase/integrase n=1 Tax=Reyranella sp. TaxID=1929291 RepID=UPI003D11E450